MTPSKKVLIPIIGGLVVIGIGLTIIFGRNKPEPSPLVSPSPDASPTVSPSVSPSPTPTATASAYKTFRADSVQADKAFVFAAEIPTGWSAEPAENGTAINIYDPAASGATTLEKSRIYIRKFSASTFLTLSTVTIHSQTSTTVNNRPAVRYDIEKKPTVANYANQPSWRSTRHLVTDVRVSDASPSTFYVLAKNPAVSDELYAHFLSTFQVIAPADLKEPVSDFEARITKKQFGTYITPATSPVQPEKFTGYHTGVDVEFTDVAADVPVVAMAAGKVIESRTASGYGGVMAIQHTINGSSYIGVYGHLDPATMLPKGREVAAGAQIALLGDHNSAETDGERKHLHLSVVRGTTLIIAGYVSTQSELSKWIDPVSLYK